MTKENNRIIDLFDPVTEHLKFEMLDDSAFYEWVKKTKEYTRDAFYPVQTHESLVPYIFDSIEPEDYRNLVYSLIAYPGLTPRLHRIKVIGHKIYIVVLDSVEVLFSIIGSTVKWPSYHVRRSFYTVDVDTDRKCTRVHRGISDLEIGVINPLMFHDVGSEASRMTLPLVAEASRKITDMLKAEEANE